MNEEQQRRYDKIVKRYRPPCDCAARGFAKCVESNTDVWAFRSETHNAPEWCFRLVQAVFTAKTGGNWTSQVVGSKWVYVADAAERALKWVEAGEREERSRALRAVLEVRRTIPALHAYLASVGG